MKAKRTFLLITFQLLTIYAFTQKVRQGFLGGVNLALATYDFPAPETVDNAYLTTWKTSNGPGFFVGYDVEYDITDKIFVSSGLMLNSYQFKAIKTEDFINSESENEDRNKFSLFEVQLPLMVHYRMGKFSVGVGPYAALALGGSLKYQSLENGNQEIAFSQSLVFNPDEMGYSDFRPFNAGLCSEIGYGIKRWRVAAHFDLGLLNLSPKAPSTGREVQQYAMKRSNLGLSFLYQPWPR